MLDLSFAPAFPPPGVAGRRHQDRVSWWCGYLFCIGLTFVVALLAVKMSPETFSLAALLLFATIVIAVARPVAGLFLAVFWTILGDPVTSYWYPFLKNFSSHESILFVNDSMIISPVELVLVALVAGWMLQMLTTGKWELHKGRLFWPIMAFTGFLLIGFVYGMTRGGNRDAALYELRPLMYFPLIYVLTTNLFKRRKQYDLLYWFVMVGVFLTSVFAYFFYEGMSAAEKELSDSLVAHGVTLPMNAMIVLIAASWIFKGSSWWKRLLLPIMAVPVVVVYLISERRSAIIGLVAAVVLLFAVLFFKNRRLFFKVAPVVLVLGIGYTAAFWNSTSSLGFPATAIKSVIAPEQLSAADQSSDLYRQVETYDVTYTIRTNRLFGIGFGHEFLRPIELPPITVFVLGNYIPHASVLWIWLKAGIGGFIAMLYLFMVAMRTGARAVLSSPGGDDAAITFTSVAFVLMYAVFAYVDIAWDAQNMVLLGVCMAQIANAERVRERPGAPAERTVVADEPRRATRRLEAAAAS